MLVPPSSTIASMPFALISRRAFSMRARRSSSVIGIADESAALSDTSAADASGTSNRPAWRPIAVTPASAADRTMKCLRCMECALGKVFTLARLFDPHLNARQRPARSEGVPARIVSRTHPDLCHASSASGDQILQLLEERSRLYRQRLGKDTHSVAIAPEPDRLEAREELYRSHAVTHAKLAERRHRNDRVDEPSSALQIRL